jgi:RNA polymerase sigma factor (sigma-70 family)
MSQCQEHHKTRSPFTGVEGPATAVNCDRLADIEGAMHDLAGSGNQAESMDERLLRDYVASQDGRAFAGIMRRHGSMVFGVCRRILRRDQDAEDAFQATFLVLMRKAPKVSNPKLLGNWLYGVAYRVASRIRHANLQHRTREARMVDVPAPEPNDDVSWRELRGVLDDEVQRLPRRYRGPFVLFYLEGKSAEEIATALGRPRGTVLSQLGRARERLRGRLALRNLALSAGVLATLLERTASSNAAVPTRLLDWGMQLQGSSGATIEAGVSAKAKLVAGQVISDMLRRRLLMTGSIVLAVFLAFAVGILSRGVILAGQGATGRVDLRTDLDRLQGDWQVIAFERNGRSLPKVDWPFTRILIRDHTMLQEGTAHDRKVSFWVHPEQEPKSMDMQTRAFHSQIDSNFRSVPYTLKENTLTIDRPEEDEGPDVSGGKSGENRLRYTAKRITPAGP